MSESGSAPVSVPPADSVGSAPAPAPAPAAAPVPYAAGILDGFAVGRPRAVQAAGAIASADVAGVHIGLADANAIFAEHLALGDRRARAGEHALGRPLGRPLAAPWPSKAALAEGPESRLSPLALEVAWSAR